MEERRVWKNRFLTLCLTLFFATPILAPLASADGMNSCDPLAVGWSECDDYNPAPRRRRHVSPCYRPFTTELQTILHRASASVSAIPNGWLLLRGERDIPYARQSLAIVRPGLRGGVYRDPPRDAAQSSGAQSKRIANQ